MTVAAAREPTTFRCPEFRKVDVVRTPADAHRPDNDAIDLARSVEDLDRLRVVLIRIARRIRSRAQGDFSPSQLAVLGTVINHQPITNGRIAEIEHVRPPTTTRIVDTLERAGFVERTPDPDDRRCIRVTVTPEGHAYADEVRAAGRTWLAEQMEVLDADDVRSIESALPALERLLGGDLGDG